MLSDELKDSIRAAYSAIVDNNQLTPRWGQRQMIAEIANTLGRIPAAGDAADVEAGPAVCVIEAGTGTGKTIAYSVAAIPIARALGKRRSWLLLAQVMVIPNPPFARMVSQRNSSSDKVPSS